MKKLVAGTLAILLLCTSATAAAQAPSKHYCKLSDINKNGTVDVYDLSILLSNYQKQPFNKKADINSDGSVNVTDLSILLSNYGKAC